tara:strand:- start:2876 stop:4753 length:1878 start_codon:yes stop_codon:yes gene_type:complete
LFLTPLLRKAILILIDLFSITLAIYVSFWVTGYRSDIASYNVNDLKVILITIFTSLPVYLITGQYKGLSKYLKSTSLYALVLRNFCIINLLIIFSYKFNWDFPVIKIWFSFLFCSVSFSGLIRFIARDLVLNFIVKRGNFKKPIKVAIFGAGAGGARLSAALNIGGNYRIIAFFDDDTTLWGRTLGGIPIKSFSELKNIFQNIDQILIAIPSISRQRKKEIFNSVKLFNLPIMVVPGLDEIASGRAKINNLKPFGIDDLLGRGEINFNKDNLINKEINNSSICITGAGGSIGSELCRQIIGMNPSKLILIENSEPSLYKINQELKDKINSKTQLYPILGNVNDLGFLIYTFNYFKIEIVYHTAAYKHVPLVEINRLEGINNNVFSTQKICIASKKSKVNKVTLVSTDKSVRPTNVMGASKRLAELIIQSYANIEEENINNSNNEKITFSMVRFGNVLGSSGSVVPLFKKQIAEGGPVTLTHPEVIRYFMTISEASKLVLQASALSEGGDLFLLDMGEPIEIKKLAEQMIQLSGLSVRSKKNPDGDIEIITTGLRPGEKLYEELLINAEAEITSNPLIFRAKEDFIRHEILFPKLEKLNNFIKEKDEISALLLLSELVPEWKELKN